MRSSQVYRALDLIPNRYTLCQTVSQSVRRIHINGNPFEGTVSAILNGIGDGIFRGQTQACLHDNDNNAISSKVVLVA